MRVSLVQQTRYPPTTGNDEGPSDMKSDRKGLKRASGQASEFQQLAERKAPGLTAEFLDFLLHNKKWWLAPIIVMVFVLGLLAVLGGTGAAPFIYTLF